jgi:hypothetical protein
MSLTRRKVSSACGAAYWNSPGATLVIVLHESTTSSDEGVLLDQVHRRRMLPWGLCYCLAWWSSELLVVEGFLFGNGMPFEISRDLHLRCLRASLRGRLNLNEDIIHRRAVIIESIDWLLNIRWQPDRIGFNKRPIAESNRHGVI